MYSDPISGERSAEVDADFLSAMSNAKRLMILSILTAGEIAVGQLATRTGLSQSALSQHLAILRNRQLVTRRRDRQNAFYSTSSNAVNNVLSMLKERSEGFTGLEN